MFVMMGYFGLMVAFIAVVASFVCLLLGQLSFKKRPNRADSLAFGGGVAAILTTLALTLCCGVLVYCFVTGDTSIKYVLTERSDEPGMLGLLYKVSGLWAGRSGSLLFWAWLISLFNLVPAIRTLRNPNAMDNAALMVAQLVLGAFVGVCLFSESNMPFTATDSIYFDDAGNLRGAATSWGMNILLLHWAQAVHPPTLFVGYAGLTIPFAYAAASLITGDASDTWVKRCQRVAVFAWFFLSIGIGLGAIWAYVVLGWGGYWGWDPVENASLLSWLMGLALIHSFTAYRQRGTFRRWSIMCACLAFTCVVVGTFITRSGIVQSVHAFEGDPVSLVLFGVLIGASILTGIIGLLIRWKRYADPDDMESLVSKESAYYFNNVILVVFTIVLTYLTVASALPTFLPFGGQSLSSGSYEAIARPLGIAYCAIIAVCPLLAWRRTDGKAFLKQARIPAICALVLFVLLVIHWATNLLPAYNAIIAAGGDAADELLSEGPSIYYNGLSVVGLLVASLLFFNSLFMLGRATAKRAKALHKNPVAAFFQMLGSNSSKYGGFVAHLGMAVILVGLIGSNMYVTEVNDYIAYDDDAEAYTGTIEIGDYTLECKDMETDLTSNNDRYIYTVELDVYRNGEYVGTVSPAIEYVIATQATKLDASVLNFQDHDLFVVFNGTSTSNTGDSTSKSLSMTVRINPLISNVWVGFALLLIGTFISLVGRRKKEDRKLSATGDVLCAVPELAEADADAEAEPETESEPAAAAEPAAEPEAE